MAYRAPPPPIANKLPLGDPRWRELTACWSDGAIKVPRLLEELRDRPSFDPRAPSSAWAELHDIVYHQGSCYETTYAALPYLVEIGLEHPPSRSADLWISIGHMAATYRVHGDPVPDDLAPALGQALEAAEPRCLEVLFSEPWTGEENRYLALAAVALSGHRVGFLITSNLMDRDAEGEAICPSCGGEFLFALYDDGIATYSIDDHPHPERPDGSQPRRVAELHCTGHESETPWRTVATYLDASGGPVAPGGARVPERFVSEWQPELDAATQQCRFGVRGGDDRCVLCVVGALLALKGDYESASRFLRLTGGVRCPSCGVESNLFDTIEDFQE